VRFVAFRPISFGSCGVGRDEIAAPAGEVLLERVPQLRIERRQALLFIEPHPVGRIRHEHALRPPAPSSSEQVGALAILTALVHPGRGQVLARALHLVRR
jgi:hypothetical protein